MIADAAARRRPARRAHRDVLRPGSRWTRTGSPSRSTARARSSSPSRRATHGVWVCGSAPEVQPGDDRPSNTLVLAGARRRRSTATRKIHPFTYGGEHEQYARRRRSSSPSTSTASGCSLFVCYDLRFADEFWALAADTDCYVVVANWPAPRRDHWRTLLRARAIENQAYVVGVNRVGQRRQARLRGRQRRRSARSASSSPKPTPPPRPRSCADVDPAVVAETRATYPFLTDRRRPSGAFIAAWRSQSERGDAMNQVRGRGRARRARPRGRRGRRAACACRGDRSTRRS